MQLLILIMASPLDVFKMLNIEPGIYTMQICDNLNKEKET